MHTGHIAQNGPRESQSEIIKKTHTRPSVDVVDDRWPNGRMNDDVVGDNNTFYGSVACIFISTTADD